MRRRRWREPLRPDSQLIPRAHARDSGVTPCARTADLRHPSLSDVRASLRGAAAFRPGPGPIEIFPMWNVLWDMSQGLKLADVFNAVAGEHRREILDALVEGEKAVGTIVSDLSMSQPQVSKHLRVLSEAGLVQCRAEGRRRLYRLDPTPLRPLREWMEKYEQLINERLDQMDDYLKELQGQGEQQ